MPDALPLRLQVATPILAGILAGPSGERILEAEDGQANKKLAQFALEMADVLIAEAA